MTAPVSKCACGGRIDPTTNGNGGLIDRCSRCGAKPGEGRVPAGSPAGQSCRVQGCPGALDAAGRCACCDKRAARLAANLPKRNCGICGGGIGGRASTKYCAVCKPLAQKVQVEKHRATEKKPSGRGAV